MPEREQSGTIFVVINMWRVESQKSKAELDLDESGLLTTES